MLGPPHYPPLQSFLFFEIEAIAMGELSLGVLRSRPPTRGNHKYEQREQVWRPATVLTIVTALDGPKEIQAIPGEARMQTWDGDPYPTEVTQQGHTSA